MMGGKIGGRMKTYFRLMVKNYRCFTDESPLVIEFNEGFTALVGPNNSGKSSFLKMFFEFKNLWQTLIQEQAMLNLVNGESQSVGYLETSDDTEIFSNFNDRPLTIGFDCFGFSRKPNTPPPLLSLSTAEFIAEKNAPQSWKGKFKYIGGSNKYDLRWNNKNRSRFIENTLELNPSEHQSPLQHFEFFPLFESLKTLNNILYIPPFRNLINEGSSQYYGQHIGTSFVIQWKAKKTGNDKEGNRTTGRVTEDVKHIFNFDNLEINASDDGKTLTLMVDNNPFKLKELGSGISQFIYVLGSAAFAKPSFILIDEPENNLHPSLQIDFLTSLASYASMGLIFSTHSIGLARSVSEKIYSFVRKKGSATSTIVMDFSQKSMDYVEFLGEMSYSAYHALGFDRILFVEGVTDVRTYQQFLRKLKKDHEIVVLPLGGNQLINGAVPEELNELKRLSENIAIIIDSERHSLDENISKERKEFKKICEKYGFKILVTQRRATENYLSESAIQKVKGPKYKALEEYQKLKETNPSWDKSENWKIAREMDLKGLEGTDILEFLEEWVSDNS
jgi:energy-coupling factor transporter ATP-binding protein EcfA2